MANNTLIGALRAEATLESGKFVDGAKKIRQEAKKTEVQMKSSFSSMGAAVKGFGGALTAGLSIGLLGGLAKKALDYATSIGDVAKQAGVTTTQLQEFRYAAGQAGVAQGDLDKGLERLNLTLSKAASGSKSAKEALAAVGVTLKDIETKSRSDIFLQITDQIAKQGGAAKNAAALNAVFGESVAKMFPLLDQGSEHINGLRDAVHRLGGVLSEDQIQKADETARKLDDVKRVLAAQISGVVADNAASIVTLAESLAKLTSAIVNFLGSNPQAALGILGALAGSRFGLPGAALGGLTGLGIGGRIARDREDASMNFGQRAARIRELKAQLIEAKKLSSKTAPDARVVSTEKELRRQIALTNEALAARKKITGGTANVALPQFLATGGGAKKGRTARTPKAPRDRSDDVTFQFEQELRRAQMDTLRAQQSMATSADERAALALRLLDLQKEEQQAELDNRVRRAERDFAEGKITAGALEEVKVQAEKLKAQYADTDALERKAIADNLAADKARDAAALVDSDYDIRLEILQLEGALADTAAERRDVELRILAVMKEQEKARLNALLADKDSSDLAKAQAQQRLDSLDQVYAGRAATVRQNTMGPMESWQQQYGDISEELEQLKVQGIEGVASALASLTTDFQNWRDIAVQTIQQVLQELIRLQLMKLAVGLIGGAAGGGASSGASLAGSGLYSGIDPMFLGGFARGGFTGNIGSKRIAGVVHGNEFVLNSDAVRRFGVPNLDALNRGAPLSAVSNDNDGSAGGYAGDMHFHFPRGTTPQQARESGLQASRSFKRGMAYGVRGRKT